MKNSTKKRIERKKFPIWRNIIANKIFNDYCYTGDFNETLRQIKKHRGVLVNLRKYLLETSCYPDYGNGFETYGYEALGGIQANLTYISDRFIAEYRLQWMIDLVDHWPEIKENILYDAL